VERVVHSICRPRCTVLCCGRDSPTTPQFLLLAPRPTFFTHSPLASSVRSLRLTTKKFRRHSLRYDLDHDHPPERRLHPRLALGLHPLASFISLPFPHALPISQDCFRDFAACFRWRVEAPSQPPAAQIERFRVGLCQARRC
jgi:hypothetical protein